MLRNPRGSDDMTVSSCRNCFSLADRSGPCPHRRPLRRPPYHLQLGPEPRATEKGFHDTPGRSNGLTVTGDYAFVADQCGGLVILRYVPQELWGPLVLRGE
jgi:hypothetical protein